MEMKAFRSGDDDRFERRGFPDKYSTECETRRLRTDGKCGGRTLEQDDVANAIRLLQDKGGVPFTGFFGAEGDPQHACGVRLNVSAAGRVGLEVAAACSLDGGREICRDCGIVQDVRLLHDAAR